MIDLIKGIWFTIVDVFGLRNATRAFGDAPVSFWAFQGAAVLFFLAVLAGLDGMFLLFATISAIIILGAIVFKNFSLPVLRVAWAEIAEDFMGTPQSARSSTKSIAQKLKERGQRGL